VRERQVRHHDVADRKNGQPLDLKVRDATQESASEAAIEHETAVPDVEGLIQVPDVAVLDDVVGLGPDKAAEEDP